MDGTPTAGPESALTEGPHCTGCGSASCPGCRRTLDPPRFCATCGRRLTVTVTPGGWRARCRDHGTGAAPEA